MVPQQDCTLKPLVGKPENDSQPFAVCEEVRSVFPAARLMLTSLAKCERTAKMTGVQNNGAQRYATVPWPIPSPSGKRAVGKQKTMDGSVHPSVYTCFRAGNSSDRRSFDARRMSKGQGRGNVGTYRFLHMHRQYASMKGYDQG